MAVKSFAGTFLGFLFSGFFGISGALCVGSLTPRLGFPESREPRSAVWYGNIGTAITRLGAPKLLETFTIREELEGWRTLPLVYGGRFWHGRAIRLVRDSSQASGSAQDLQSCLSR